MINGAENVMVVVLAREVNAMAETKKTMSASEDSARRKWEPMRCGRSPPRPTLLVVRKKLIGTARGRAEKNNLGDRIAGR